MGIGSYLVRGEEARAMMGSTLHTPGSEVQGRPEKKQRLDNTGQSIQRFFKADSVDEHDEEFGALQALEETDLSNPNPSAQLLYTTTDLAPENSRKELPGILGVSVSGSTKSCQQSIGAYLCSSCGKSFRSEESFQDHQDWHFAKSLQEEDRVRRAESIPPRAPSIGGRRKTTMPGKRTRGGSAARPEKGQSKLSFG